MGHPHNRAERRRVAELRKAKHRRDAALYGYFPEVVSDTRHPLDCGNPNCGVCSNPPFDKHPTLEDELDAA